MEARMSNLVEKQHPTIAPIHIVAIIPIICLAPFVAKAFHIDDTLFLWSAKHILTNPADFYGFKANWYGQEMPMFLINKNPPLISYYIAFVAFLFGWNEVILHLAFLIPAVGLSLGTYYLARSLCPWPHLAALIAVLTPVFLVSSTNIMSDTIMVAFYVWAIALWLRGLKEDNSSYLLVATFCMVLSALTKYFGLTLLPLLLVYSLMEKRKLGSWIVYLIIPVLLLVGYQWLTYKLYGKALLSDAASYAIQGDLTERSQFLTKTIVGLAFTGGCLAAVGFYAPLLWSRRFWAAGGVLTTLLLAALLGTKTIGDLGLHDADSIRWGLILQLALFVSAGIHILVLAGNDMWHNRDASSLLLFLWIIGTFLFASFVNWTTNGRTILPMVPAAGILVMRRYGQRDNRSRTYISWPTVWPLIPAAAVALAVTWADYSLANCQRSAAHIIRAESHEYPFTIWFQGHWGFQYYMERIGAKSLDFNNSMLKQGDIIITPSNNTNLELLRPESVHLVGKRQLMPCRWLGTMQKTLGAGFYSDIWGPLPFAVGAARPEEYLLLLVGAFDDSAEAIDRFREALRIKPDYANAYNELKKTFTAPEYIDRTIARTLEALKLNPENPALHSKLGSLYESKGELDKAMVHYRRVLQLNPDSAETHSKLGNVLEQQGKVKEALFQYSMALRLQPGFAETYFNLGNVLVRQGNYEDAIVHFSKALELKPNFFQAHTNLGILLDDMGKLDEAIAHYSMALRIKPDYVNAHVQLALALIRKGETEEAIKHYRRALQLRPDWPEVLNNLAWIFATHKNPKFRDGAEALQLAQKACELTHYKQANFLDTLAAAYAEEAQFSKAVQTAQQAIQLAHASNRVELAKAIEKHLQLYEAGKTFYEGSNTLTP